jgi:hypothetical protein
VGVTGDIETIDMLIGRGAVNLATDLGVADGAGRSSVPINRLRRRDPARQLRNRR